MSLLKKIIACALCFALYGQSFISAQATLNNGESSAVQETVSDSGMSEFESFFSPENQLSKNSTNSAAGTFFLILKMLVFLAVVIGVIYVVLYLFKRSVKLQENNDKFLRQVASVSLAPGKTVQVVTLLDKKAFVVGVTENSINLISEFENPDAKPEDYKELIQAMNLYSDSQKNVQRPKNFADILEIFMPNGPRDVKTGKTSSGIFSDLLNRQKNNFNGEDRE